MLYVKIFLFCLFPLVVLGQGYYTEQTQNSSTQLSLNNNWTFSYTEQSPIGNFIFNVSGTYTKSNGGFTGEGWDSRSNSKVILAVTIESNSIVLISIAGRQKRLTKR